MSGQDNQSEVLALRNQIDDIDHLIRELVEQRVSIAKMIIEMKDAPVADEAREKTILSRCKSQLQKDVQRRLILESKRRALDGDDSGAD